MTKSASHERRVDHFDQVQNSWHRAQGERVETIDRSNWLSDEPGENDVNESNEGTNRNDRSNSTPNTSLRFSVTTGAATVTVASLQQQMSLEPCSWQDITGLSVSGCAGSSALVEQHL